MTTNNPLLDLAEGRCDLPDFSAIRPEHAEAALDAILAENRARIDALIASNATQWHELAEPLEALDERVHRVFGPVGHLFSVCSTEAWRAAYNACLPKLTDYSLELSQSRPLFEAWQRLRNSEAFDALSEAQQAAVEHHLRDYRLAGVALDEQPRQRYRALAMQLSEWGTRFEEHLLDTSQAWSLTLPDAERLSGMSASAIAAAKQRAEAKDEAGYRLTLDFPSFNAVISHADDRALRETLYEAWSTRASDAGPHDARFDNSPVMEQILAARHEQAQLLGYSDYAALSLAPKMADDPDTVERFLLDLAHRARPRAERELAELTAFARERDGIDALQPWDLPYYSEKLREQRLGLSDEILKPYFPLDAVLAGLFDLIETMYGVQAEAVNDVPVWHDSVTVYRLFDADGQSIGLFYLDPYAREHKRGGAWMNDGRSRRRSPEGLQTPVAYLVGNFTPPLAGQPPQLTHQEVLTLFHEAGHGLHHLLTQVDVAAVSGINNVAWDAVELPSQFMENFCYDRRFVQRMSRHVDSGQPLPDHLLETLQADRQFGAGLATLRQVEFALFDLRLHRDFDPARGGRVLETLKAVRDEVAVLQPPAYNRFPNSFSHIFAGGYAAGYYSYKWAEVLSADAFAAFEEAGVLDADTGRRFRDCILARGGTRDAGSLFRAFRGRDPEIDALLRQDGLLDAA
ncbi:M3 family metallopeptidase [Algiphilus sp.]|uniref:M3 family metallopeptidase n=1 Tax=Algiphilus sp. TaxID=1872431 RepID=UPI002A5B71C1|nr:M3 family metallopeptidase [Pseudomonadota bacterium]